MICEFIHFYCDAECIVTTLVMQELMWPPEAVSLQNQYHLFTPPLMAQHTHTYTHTLYVGFISYQNMVFYRILLSTFTTRDRWYFKVRVTWWLNEWHLEYVFPFFSIFAEKTSLSLSSEKKNKKKKLIWEMNGYTCQAGILYTHTSSFHIITLQLPESCFHFHSPWDRADHTAHTPHVQSTHTWCTYGEPAALSHSPWNKTQINHSSTITYCMCGIIIIINV